MFDSAATDINTTIWDWIPATTDSSPFAFAEFWAAVGTNYWLWEIPEIIRWNTTQLHATELSIHGKTPGKLKDPKPKPPRGYAKARTLRNEYSGGHYN